MRDTTTHKMDHSNLLLYRTFPWLSTLRVLLNLLDRGDSFKSIQLIIKSYDARSHKLERILDFCIKWKKLGDTQPWPQQYTGTDTRKFVEGVKCGVLSYSLLGSTSNNTRPLTWTLISWQTRIHSLGLPLSWSIEESHSGVGDHGGVTAGDLPTLRGRAGPLPGGVAEPAGVSPEDVAGVTVVSCPTAVHIAPAEIGHFYKSILCGGRVIALHFWKHFVLFGPRPFRLEPSQC